MSISSTATKVEEFELEAEMKAIQADDFTITGSTQVEDTKEDFDVSTKSLDANQLYLGEIGFSPLPTRRRGVVYASCSKRKQS